MQDILRFSSRSADKKPGRGAGETAAHPELYAALARIEHWRRVLSNFHVAPFVHGKKTYNMIEHAFQAAKIELQDSETAAQFALESGSELARGDGLAARKARKIVVLTPANVARWNAMSGKVMARIADAKFAQVEQARVVLAATHDAQLWHVAPRTPAVRFTHLETIRGHIATSP